MATEDNLREIFRRLEATDNHIVSIQNKMLDLQKDVDEKFNIINNALLKIVGKKNDSDSSPWVRQTVGLTVAVITILGFFITIMHFNTQAFSRQILYEGERRVELQSRFEKHLDAPWHPAAAIAIARHQQLFDTKLKEEDIILREMNKMEQEIVDMNNDINSRLSVLEEKVAWTEDEIMFHNQKIKRRVSNE